MVFKYIVHDYKGRASLMKLAKSILCILGWVLLLCLSFIAILVPISELRYVFTMAPYPYMLYGECCKFIEFIGGVEIRTIYYVVLLLIYLLIQLSCLLEYIREQGINIFNLVFCFPYQLLWKLC